MKKICFLYSLLLSFSALSCKLESYAKILKINRVIDETIIAKTDCSDEITNNFILLINNAQGKLNSTFIRNYFQSTSKIKVTLYPASIEVINLKEIIEKKYGSNKFSITDISSLLAKSTLNLTGTQQIHLDCQNCDSAGKKNLKLSLNSEQKHWISATFKLKLIGYKVKNSINAMTPLLVKDDFQKIELTSRHGNNLFQDIQNISFYQAIRNLNKGDVIKVNDLRPKKLINHGQRVKLTIINKDVVLKTIGIAKKSGKIGEFIEIQNPKSKKVFLGKITNYNEALVEL